MRVENGHDGADGFTHEVDPRERQASVGLGVVEWQDLCFEHVKEARDIHFVLKFRIGLIRALGNFRTDGPAVFSSVCLAPPAIENAQI